MSYGKKQSLKNNSGRGLKRFKLFSSSSGDSEPSASSAQQANTPSMPGTGPQHMPEHLEPLHLPSAALPPSNVEPCDNTPNPPPASISYAPPNAEQSAKRDRWAELKALAKILRKGFDNFGPLKQAVEGIVAGIEIFETAAQSRADYENLRNDLNGLFHDLAKFFDASTPPVMAPTIINFAQGIDRELEIVRLKLSETRIGTHPMDADKVLEHYRRIQALLQRLTSDVGFTTLRIVDEQTTETRLKLLPHSPAAKYSSAESSDLRSQCTENTRIHVLEELYEWACNDKSPRIYWLNGMAGTGKTTIAYSLCERLERSKKLAASFFCSRQLPSCRDVNRIVPTISYQLSRFSRPFRSVISRLLEEDPDVHNQVLLDQFKSLIVEPLGHVNDAFPTNLVVVIDALDECDNNDGVDRMLNALLTYVRGLPLKFFVASRPDAKILDRMRGLYGASISTELRLHELDRPTVQEDIKTYLTVKLMSHMSLSVANLDILVKRSGVLFIYASTVARYLEIDNFSRADDRLEEMLKVSKDSLDDSEKDINDLYATILKGAYNNPKLTSQERDELKLVLDTVICSKEPLSIDVMAGLLGLGAGKVRAALRSLFSVLHLSDTAHTITTLHESFPDYLLDETRSKFFHCNAYKHNAQLTRLCFEQIKVPNPPFNICHLESSYVFDKDVQDLPARVKTAISRQLLYACRYWVAHYMLADQSQDLANMLHEFASERFLLWMEVVNLGGCLHESVKVLYNMRRWSRSADHLNESMREFIRDMCDFATSFSSSAAMFSTPHLYVSTLTFWRHQNPITEHYGQQRIRLITERSTAMSARMPAPLAVLQHENVVRGVAYSPDGAYIVSSSDDITIRIWDAYTGQLVGQPLRGHTSSVNTVAYSPDGAYIVSGSDDRTIRIWDVHTRQQVGQPLKGHTDLVHSVACSPDGAFIVSGSQDKTIRIWDAHTCQPVGQPLKGPNSYIYSIAYSPDGAHIISGSHNGEIHVWDAHTGQPLGRPLYAPNNRVYSVAYSPDGAYVISGLHDGKIRVWDAHAEQLMGQPWRRSISPVDINAAYSPDSSYIVSNSPNYIRNWDADPLVGQPLRGHTSSVNTVAYSPDGAYIVSGSDDRTIRIWDVHTRQQVGQPLKGHTDFVHSVACSPDGAFIASGSQDKTIRIWDTNVGQLVAQPLQGHTSRLHSVAYSPDAAYIVSGSHDGNIRIWDAHTYQPVEHLLQEYSHPVNSVVYSPDGAYIVSGFHDGNIRVLDAHTGRLVGQPLQGHTRSVNTVTYSPDGAYIVSGSDDRTIRICEAQACQSVRQRLQGHTRAVNSVAYSPDGAFIVSGSSDQTIRIWDAHTGQTVGQPLQGHASELHSVAYSPDGRYIVSGSQDGIMYIWDAGIGQTVRQQLQVHTDSVSSVVYSPDGAYIVTGSYDGSVRIWDAHNGQPVGRPLRGHTGPVNSVAYSSDGTFIISGSQDETIRIWDTRSTTPTSTNRESYYHKSQVTHPLHVTSKVNSTKRCVICDPGYQTDCPHMAWTLHKDGWISFNHNKLIWVPPDLRVSLLRLQNSGLISRCGFLQLDLERNKLGEHWHEYFQPGWSMKL